MFIGFYNRSIILTFLGLFFSVFGIKFCLDGDIYISLLFLILSGICDCFDGYVASLVKRNDKEKLYGIELDSLVDVVCFGVFPIIIGISLGYTKYYNLLIYFIYLFCGITRLCYFNVDNESKKYFKGLPITTISFLLPVVVSFTYNEFIIMGMYLIFAFLFICNFKISKLSLKYKKIIFFLGIFLMLFVGWRLL